MTQAPGRLLIYCSDCRREMQESLALAVPLSVLDQDPEAFLLSLYRAGTTASDPASVADLLGVPQGAWSEAARGLVGGTDIGPAPPTPESAAAPFAVSVHTKALSLQLGLLTPVQQRRLRESISYDIRKCSDILCPDFIPFKVSRAAHEIVAPLGVDLTNEIWHTQPRFDPGRQLVHFEHYYPIGHVAKVCIQASSSAEVLRKIVALTQIVWITKDEDWALRQLGFASNRPDPAVAYAAAGIELLPGPQDL